MKTAKEWAAEVFGEPYEDGGRWHVDLRDADDWVALERQVGLDDADSIRDDARAIIERLVERVQVDALGVSIHALHAKLSVLAATLDPEAIPEGALPRGRIETALRLAREALGVVERATAARAPLEAEIARLRIEAETHEGVARRVLRIARKRVGQMKEERDAALAEVDRLRARAKELEDDLEEMTQSSLERGGRP